MLCIFVKPFLPGRQSCFSFLRVTHRSQDKGVGGGGLREGRQVCVSEGESFVKFGFSIKKAAGFTIRLFHSLS